MQVIKGLMTIQPKFREDGQTEKGWQEVTGVPAQRVGSQVLIETCLSLPHSNRY